MMYTTMAALLLLILPDRRQQDASLDERIRRLDSLVSRRVAELNTERQRSLTAGGLVELRVGGYVLEVEPDLTAVAREAAALAWARVKARGGSWLARELPRFTLTMYQLERRRALRSARKVIVVETEPPRSSVDSTRWWEEPAGMSASTDASDALGVAGALVSLAERLAFRATDEALREWLQVRTNTRSFRDEFQLNLTGDSEGWRATRRDLSLMTSRTNRECLDGTIGGCLASLGVGDTDDQATRTWYAPEDYPWLAALVGHDSRDTTMRVLRDTCTQTRDVSLCERFVHRAWDGNPWRPLGTTPRASLLGLVLDRGGEGALDRLLAARGSPEERLAAAAGESLDATATVWQARVMSARAGALLSARWSWLSALALSAAGIALAAQRRVS